MLFFEGLGYSFNPQFTDENAACLVISESIFVMLLTEAYFVSFTGKELCDTQKASEVIVALSAESKSEVETIVAKAKALGAGKHNEPQDHGWMYQHGFSDLDGHLWEYAYMNMTQLPS